jgi:hypothetical protein
MSTGLFWPGRARRCFVFNICVTCIFQFTYRIAVFFCHSWTRNEKPPCSSTSTCSSCLFLSTRPIPVWAPVFLSPRSDHRFLGCASLRISKVCKFAHEFARKLFVASTCGCVRASPHEMSPHWRKSTIEAFEEPWMGRRGNPCASEASVRHACTWCISRERGVGLVHPSTTISGAVAHVRDPSLDASSGLHVGQNCFAKSFLPGGRENRERDKVKGIRVH